MAGSEDKNKAHENKFAHDSEIQFKVQARRNKLLGLWAAGKMGLSVDESEKRLAVRDGPPGLRE